MTEENVREIAREEARTLVQSIIDPMKLWTFWKIIENNVRLDKREGVRD